MRPRAHENVNDFGTIKLGAKPKVVVHLEPVVEQASRVPSNETPSPSAGETPAPLTIRPGGTVAAKLRVDRNGFDDRIAFDVTNLPHGIIVDDIGLSGVLIPEKQTERTIILRAEPWVPAQSRTFFATAQVDGNQSSPPLMLRVER